MERALEMDVRSETLRTASPPTSGRLAPRLAVLGGLLGAVAASSCCILPLLLFSIGAGSAWIGNLTALAPYQPAFIVITLGLLGYGYWLVYRSADAACADGDACARPVPNRLVKAGLWTATAITAAALGFPYGAPALPGI
jgi:mercuric ion transport protein